MEKEDEEFYNKESPVVSSSFLSKITFGWTFPTFWKGYKRDLNPNDLFSPLDEHRSTLLGGKIEKSWQAESLEANKWARNPSLLRVLVQNFGFSILRLGAILTLMEVVVRVSQPLFLGGLMEHFRAGGHVSRAEAYAYATGVVVCTTVNILVIHPYMMGIMHVGMKIRLACCSLVYRKALKLSKTALGDATIGQVVNLISNDVARFDSSVLFLPYLLIGPLQTLAVTGLLWQQIGVASVIGVAALLTFIPVQMWLGKKTSIIRLRSAARTDKRVRLMNEIIAGVQVIKMYTWELPFTRLVHQARRAELKEISKSAYIRGVLSSFTIFHIRIAIFASILAYVFSGNYINATKVFVVISYYNVLQHTMTVYMPKAITQGAEALISIKRLQDFLLSGEASLGVGAGEGETPLTNAARPLAVAMTGVCARWAVSTHDDTLSQVCLHVRTEQLVAVIGPVGCGKTSLLHAILGELPLRSGTLRVRGSTSYASQEPWLFAGSIRQNILFGAPYDKHRYRQVVEVCALWQDFKQLFLGDKTIVGDRGESLSGGQRARINLARAVYKQADIYLLDDPLSAVDPRVSKHLFQQCIKGFLKNKTVILVTHQLQRLNSVQHIVFMQGGSIVSAGSYRDVQQSGLQFTKLLSSSMAVSCTGNRLTVPTEDTMSCRTRLHSHPSIVSSVDGGCGGGDKMSVEDYASGGIRSYVFAEYFSAAGHGCTVALMLAMCLITQLLANGGDYWITYWVKLEENVYPRNISSLSELNESNLTVSIPFYTPRNICIAVFSFLTCATFVVTLLRSFLFFFMCMRASMKLHRRMFQSVTRATMHFFQNTSSGRILNRFAKDIGSVDENLPNCLLECIQRGLTLLGVILVVGVVNPWVLLPTLLISFPFYFLRKLYLSTSRSVKRLENIARSPVFAHMSASLQGLTTIRAFQAQEMLTQEFDYHQDVHSSAWFMFLASSRAFGFWLDVVCLIYISMVVFSFLILNLQVYGGVVGLSITQAMGLTGMLQFGMRQSAELENFMTSVERVLEYSMLESEPPLENPPEIKMPEKWPSEGRIEFKNVSMHYSLKLPRVLKDITFHIKPSEKIGIVGRTGAGKSSLVSALFRLQDVTGQVLIDHVDTHSIGLHTLRAHISIIPQEPVLFSGTLRANLDPFLQYSDEQLWDTLAQVELREAVCGGGDDGGLERPMAEGGSNFSVGQRQLVCLARAILRNNRVLILDEATANVDPQTDTLIQSTIRRKFADCTVLTIAHRLHTVMDSDRLIVMDAGVLVEFDHPWLLLRDENGFLSRMVRESGPGAAELLHAIAAQSYEKLKVANKLADDCG